ncbi:hypothetical protein OAQ99_07560, partial [Candidatus Kapabacteria bacterium]|nr:hypothetical protein [Candidatus Kapabacteria bacterium]
MSRISAFLILLFAFASFSFSYTFDVKTVSGSVKYQKAGKGSWNALSKGIKLDNGDQLKISSGAHLNLVHSNGNPIEVSKSGNYSIEKLAAKANTKKSDVTKKFTNYLLDELGDSEDLLAEGNLSDNMSTLGAVERAIPKFSPNSLNLGFPRSSYSLEDKVVFNWYQFKNNQNYTFVLKNDMEEVVLEKETTGTSIELDLEQIGLEKGICYYWSVISEKTTSEELCVYRMLESKQKEF